MTALQSVVGSCGAGKERKKPPCEGGFFQPTAWPIT